MGQALRVFLADGSEEFLNVLQAALERQKDIQIVGRSSSGSRAYAQILQEQPDVLVTDVLLPSLDGLSLLQRLHAEGRMPCTLVLSAFVNEYIVQAVSLAGAMDYLQKPCEPAHLAERIRDAARGGRSSAPLGYDLAIRDALARFGIPSHLNGSAYLREAIRRAIMDRSVLHGVTKVLYPELAAQFETTACCVERSIRAAVNEGWQAETPQRRNEYFGPTFDRYTRAPSNVKFIAAIITFLETRARARCWF